MRRCVRTDRSGFERVRAGSQGGLIAEHSHFRLGGWQDIECLHLECLDVGRSFFTAKDHFGRQKAQKVLRTIT